MNFGVLKHSWNNLIDESRHQKRTVMGLFVVIFILLWMLLSREQIVVVQPETLTENATVSPNGASSNYMDAWGLFFSQLIGNITPSNVEFVKDKLGMYLHPSIYHQVIDLLEVQAQQIKKDSVTIRFEPRTIDYEQESGKLFVFGRSYIRGARGKDIREERTYEFKIKMTNYLPSLTYVDTYVGVGRTESQLNKLAAKEEKDKQ